jgi:HAD superfamily hydrolase (TIGR01509 family)
VNSRVSPRRRYVLLDYHGVISDGERLPAEWRRLLGEFLGPRFGGSPEIWASANRHALVRELQRAAAIDALARYEERRRADRVEWLRDMLVFAGVEPPAEPELDRVALEAIAYVVPRTRATVPWAAETVRELGGRGYLLFTSSGDDSANLDGYLRGLGVRDLFVETYGADLIGVPKTRPEFYIALAAHARIDPHEAVVVDDDAWRLDWAAQLGMDTVLVGAKHVGASHRRAATFADLVDVLP